jgi:ribosomal protein L11 methyltransferase
VQVEVDQAQVELASDALWQAGPSAVLEVDLGGGRVRLTADVERPEDVPPAWGPTVLDVDDDGYLDAWRTWAAPIRAGRRVVLQPAWIPRRPAGPAGPEELVVRIDPGRAFGSGSHETTRLAVALLEDEVAPGDAVLDVGCGSGVLALVAVALGAGSALAIDVDPAAVAAALANAEANGVAVQLEVAPTPLAEVAGAFDLVVANIGGSVLFEAAGELAARVADGGRLVLSGILVDRADALVAAFDGFEERGRSEEGGWVGLVLSRPAGAAS